jgi:hypothetical protein
MSNISYIKGVRTRFRKTLESEIKKATDLLESDYEEYELEERIAHVSKCVEKLKAYREKVETQSEKFASLLKEDDTDLIQNVLEEDCDLCTHAMDMFLDLQHYREKLLCAKEKMVIKPIAAEESDTNTLIQIQKDMQKILSAQLKQQELSYRKESERTLSVKLPKIDMASFNGDKTKWLEFWDSFNSAVHSNKMLTKVDKFNYLRSKLIGEAKDAIAGLAFTNENYLVAIEILEKRFGKAQEIIDVHYNQLINIPSADNNIRNLRYLLDQKEKHVRSLEVLEQRVN